MTFSVRGEPTVLIRAVFWPENEFLSPREDEYREILAILRGFRLATVNRKHSSFELKDSGFKKHYSNSQPFG